MILVTIKQEKTNKNEQERCKGDTPVYSLSTRSGIIIYSFSLSDQSFV